jgi:hypothetical protein
MKPAYLTGLALPVLLALNPISAAAQDLVVFDSVAGWDILVDPTVGNSCLINSVFDDGSDVRIGFDIPNDSGYLLAMNEAWGDITEGQTYPIQMDLDGTIYEGEGTGLYIDGMPGVDIVFDNFDFLMDVAAKNTLTLINESGPVMTIDLSGTLEALEAAIACQEAQM